MCAKSLDCGTMFLVKGEIDDLSNGVAFTSERNAFLQVASNDDTIDILKDEKWSYAKYQDNYYILGEDALKLKNMLTISSQDHEHDIIVQKVGELRRPMKSGILNTGEEKLSVAIIQKIIENLLGKPSQENEVLCFCVPGDPIDSNLSVVFHKTMLSNFLKSLGYQVECIPEALAIIFSERPVTTDPETGEEAPFSGVSFSFGAGMCNVCLKGDTLIPLLDGRTLTIAELATENKEFWVYSCKEDGQIVPGKAHSPRLTRKNSELIKVYLDDNSYFECTPDHLILTRDGRYVEAQNLSEGDSLMPLYRLEYRHPNGKHTYEKVKNNRTGRWVATHRLVASIMSNTAIKRDQVVHHKNFNGKDNTPSNLDILSSSDHTKLHGILAEYSRSKLLGKTLEEIFGLRAEEIRTIRRNGIIKAMQDPDIRYKMSNGLMKYNKLWKGKSYRDKYGVAKSDEIKEKFSEAKTGRSWEDQMESVDAARNRKKQHSQCRLGKAGKYVRTDDIKDKTSKSLKGNTPWNKGLSGEDYKKHFVDGMKNQYSNHKVLRVEKSEKSDVYDMTVEKYHNFAIGCGVFVHNCFGWKKMPLVAFSTSRGGDWLDIEASKVAGVNVSAITRFKEKHLDLNKIDYGDMKQAALDIFYQQLIEHSLDNFSERFKQLETQIDSPLDIVIAGGTAVVPGFLNKFKSVLNTKISGLPFKVKDVRMAQNPLLCVSNGCLVKAMSVEGKNPKKDVSKK